MSNLAKRRRAIAWARYETRVERLTQDYLHEPSPGYLRAVNRYMDRHRHYPAPSKRMLRLLESFPEFLAQFGEFADRLGRAMTETFDQFLTDLRVRMITFRVEYERRIRLALLARLARAMREVANRGGTHAGQPAVV